MSDGDAGESKVDVDAIETADNADGDDNRSESSAAAALPVGDESSESTGEPDDDVVEGGEESDAAVGMIGVERGPAVVRLVMSSISSSATLDKSGKSRFSRSSQASSDSSWRA